MNAGGDTLGLVRVLAAVMSVGYSVWNEEFRISTLMQKPRLTMRLPTPSDPLDSQPSWKEEKHRVFLSPS